MRMIKSHMYANTEKDAVTMKTMIASIRRVSGVGIEKMQMPVMHNRLNAADPTIVPGPRAPASNLLPENIKEYTVCTYLLVLNNSSVDFSQRSILAFYRFHFTIHKPNKSYAY